MSTTAQPDADAYNSKLRAIATSMFPGRSLSPKEIDYIVRREKFNDKHKGHEGMHLI
ncbi:hypothetical protein EC988_009832, partial [Linderina pennispora]